MHYVFDSSVCLCVCHVTAWADPAHHVGGREGQDCYFGSEARERGGVLGEGQPALSPPARGLGERCKLPNGVWAEPRSLKGFLAF